MSGKYVAPFLRYRHPEESAAWLEHAFGFELEDVVKDAAGETDYVSMRAGDSSIIIGRTSGTQFDELLSQPDDVGGRGTQTCYLAVDNIKSHHLRAVAAGATIEVEPQFDPGGNSYYVCRDPEGHLWSFGTHQLKAFPAERSDSDRALQPVVANLFDRLTAVRRKWVSIATVATVVAVTGVALAYANLDFAEAPNTVTVRAEADTKARQYAMLLVQSRDERRQRIIAEKAAEAAARHRADALAVVDQLKAKLTEAQGALVVAKTETSNAIKARDRARAALTNSVKQESSKGRAAQQQIALLSEAYDQANSKLESARTREAEIHRNLTQMSQQLAAARKETDELNAARDSSAEAARVAAAKLREANALNIKLTDKLARAEAEISAARREKREADDALEKLQANVDSKSKHGESRLVVTLAKLAKVTKQMHDERARRQRAEKSLKRTERDLAAVRVKSKRIATTVAKLQKELKDSREKIRRFAILRRQDSQTIVALPSPPRPSLAVRRNRKVSTSARVKTRKRAQSRKRKKLPKVARPPEAVPGDLESFPPQQNSAPTAIPAGFKAPTYAWRPEN